MKLHHRTLIAFLLTAASCSQHKDRIVINSLKGGLASSNQMLTNIIDLNYQVLTDRIDDPLLHDLAIVWAPKITLLHKSSDVCMAYLDSVATGRVKDRRELERRLFNCQQALQSITTNVPVHIGLPVAFESLDDDTALQQAMFSRIKNDILRAEYSMLKYSSHQLSHERMCIDYGPEMMISNTRIRKGDTVSIIGWYGMTISGIDLTMTVRDTTIPQKQEEPIEYKFMASGSPGTYSLPVQMHYTKGDGTTGVVEKTLKYTITR